MSYIETNSIQHSTILRLYSEKEEILLEPDYQRMGGIWNLQKKQLLIDSILNNYDIPKIYFHQFSRAEKNNSKYSYAVIDGRQRLETIWDFIEGKFPLSNDFIYQDNNDISLSSMNYNDIAEAYPKIKIKFDSFVLPVVGISTDDIELIEDMFSRLNEAAPLNAAEKRNALGGPMVEMIRHISNHSFFKNKVAFSNKRYQHLESAARIILIEDHLIKNNKIIDTKKEYLDAIVKAYKKDSKNKNQVIQTIEKVLDQAILIFTDKDDLLRAQGNIVIYYLLVKSALLDDKQILRQQFIRFRDEQKKNRLAAEEEDFENASFELLEFDRLTQQGTNDSSNIKQRLRVLCDFMNIMPCIQS